MREIELRPQAQPDGISDHTPALQSALDRAAQLGAPECQAVVVLAPGHWRSGPLQLASYVTLRLCGGATLQALPQRPFAPAYIGALAQHGEALLFAQNATRCAVEGPGLVPRSAPNAVPPASWAVIDGAGAAWWPQAQAVRAALKRGEYTRFAADYPGIAPTYGLPRPWLMEFCDCTQVHVAGLKLTQAPMWTLVVRQCSEVLLEQLWIDNPAHAPNTDGIDVVSSRRVLICDCVIATGDDNIALKSGLMPDSAPPTQEVVIRRCQMSTGHGISVGSETANGIKDVVLTELEFVGTGSGLRIKSARDRGHEIGPVYARKLDMRGVAAPLVITCSYTGLPRDGAFKSLSEPLMAAAPCATTPYVHDITIEQLTAHAAQWGPILSGLPEAPLQHITLRQLQVESRSGLVARYLSGKLEHCTLCAEGALGPDCQLVITQ